MAAPQQNGRSNGRGGDPDRPHLGGQHGSGGPVILELPSDESTEGDDHKKGGALSVEKTRLTAVPPPSGNLLEKWSTLNEASASDYLDFLAPPPPAGLGLSGLRNLLPKTASPSASAPASAAVPPPSAIPDFIAVSHRARSRSRDRERESNPPHAVGPQSKTPVDAAILDNQFVTKAVTREQPGLAPLDPPWLPFVGFAPGMAKSTNDWREALRSVSARGDFFARLHAETVAAVQWLELSPEELLLRQRVTARVSVIASHLWPRCKTQLFGSLFTGLSLPNGDLDLCLEITGPSGRHEENKEDSLHYLNLLAVCLTRFGVASALELIENATVPIVKFVDSETGIPVDVSFHTESALSTSRFVRESLQKFPPLRPLLILLKLYLQQRGLNETYRGGVGSYLLFVLVLSFLQQMKSDALQRRGLGHLLYDFFQLYGRDFNFDTTGISVRNGGSYFRKVSSARRRNPSLRHRTSPIFCRHLEIDSASNGQG